MKINSTNSVLLFVTFIGIGYALTSQYVFHKPQEDFLITSIVLLVAGMSTGAAKKTSAEK